MVDLIHTVFGSALFLLYHLTWWNIRTTDTQRELFSKIWNFGLGQTNWAEIFWGIWNIFGQTISTILALWVPCPWENVAGSFSYKKLWFLGLKHITPKCSQNKILAVKNLEKSLHTSVIGGEIDWLTLATKVIIDKSQGEVSLLEQDTIENIS